VLSGQHSVLALRRVAEQYVADLLEVPPTIHSVMAVVLRPQTPPEIRELASGDAQAVQAQVKEVTIPEFARLLLTEYERNPHPEGKGHRLALAYRKSGWDRAQSTVRVPAPGPLCVVVRPHCQRAPVALAPW
jgi:hypothetical protein